MDIEERIASLRQTDLFTAFSEEELRRFADHVAEVSLAHGDTLFTEGEAGNEMFVLVKGSLKVYKENRVITMVRPGDYVGEMGIIEAKPRSATVQATAPSLLLSITGDQFRGYLARQPRSLVAMMATLSQRIRRDTEVIAADFERANILIHDMKNALSTFLYLDLLKKECQPESPSARFIDRMQQARANLATMMEEALASARQLWQPLPMEASSLASLITEVIATECRVHPAIRDMVVVADLDPQVPEFPFSRLEIRRVLINLMVNGAQASQPGDTILVTLGCDNEAAEVAVRDQGCGIPDSLLDKIFIPHFTTKEGGNGLGLASCKQIIEERHHGTLTAHANPDRGATFRFRLPFRQAADATATRKSA